MNERVSTVRRALTPWALLLAALLVSLLLAEAVVRATGVAPGVVLIRAGRFRLSENPRLGYEPRPGVDYHGDDLDLFGFRGASNSLGYRDREPALEKPEGVFRILVLGDSIGAGLYIERLDEIFPMILEKSLRKRGFAVDVINFSVPGYNTLQEVETLKVRGLRYRPDLVLLAYCLNDVALNDGGIVATLLERERKSGGIPRNRVAGRWAVRSALYRFLRYSVLPRWTRPAVDGGPDRLQHLSEDTTEPSLRELGHVARANGLQVLVAIFPEFSNLSDYPYRGVHNRVARLSRENGFLSVDLLSTFKFCEAMIDGEIAYDRYHPTPPGHRCAAEALSAFIQEEILGAPPS